MQFGLPIDPTDLIARFVKQLQAKIGLPADCVFETLADDADHCEFPPADRFVTVTPQRFVRVQSLFAGGGRFAPGWDGTIRVAGLCRFASDQELRNTRELRDKTRSTLALNLKIIDALDGFVMATDDGTGSYLREPCANSEFDVKPKRVKGGSWAVVGSTWSVKFCQTLPGGTGNP
jgi:hypothetical protein